MIRILSCAWLLLAGPALAGAPRIEVAFVLDATGSMGSYIQEARDRIKAIATDLATGTPAPEVRFGLVRYRDRGDAFVTQVVPFTRDLDAMRRALDETDADGGGDTPEAVLEGLAAGVDRLAWSKGGDVLRLIYLVGDAEAQHYRGGPTLEAVARRALERGIVIHTIACGAMSGTGQQFFELAARLAEGRPFRLADGPPARSVAGAAGTGSLAAAVSGSARAYSGAIGVGFAGRPVAVVPLELPGEPGPATGLLGAQVRHVRDAATLGDLWAAHRSLAPGAPAHPPAVDFDREHLLALGGADAGLRLVGLVVGATAQVVRLEPASPGLRLYRVPASDLPVIPEEIGAF